MPYFLEETGVAHISKYVWNIMQEFVVIWLVISWWFHHNTNHHMNGVGSAGIPLRML
jgi:hypothetical protein